MARQRKSAIKPRPLTSSLLSRWPLPQPDEDGDKEDRGRVLVVGGSREMPGAVILAATAALRAGAGKLRIATARSVAQLVASEVPEARVFALPETKGGDIAPSAAKKIARQAERVQAVLVGPGMIDDRAAGRLMRRLVSRITLAALVVDAAALFVLARHADALHGLDGRAILTPHAEEMGKLLGEDESAIESDPMLAAERAAERFQSVIVLKGRRTLIARPGGEVYSNRTGNVGLATSGSGDVLAGIIAGLAARGAEPVQAAAWAVYLHGRAGDRLAKRMGKLGFLARELLGEIPPLMNSCGRDK
ncbi:MAG TPA: NAD(P)H-hydrate dehydratase [Blastocatellia bacterium]|nr:NAD(P)H-hydrate dehydratase [Blastocatellia bacterium]